MTADYSRLYSIHSRTSDTPSDLPALSASLSLRTSGLHTPTSAVPLTPTSFSPADLYPSRMPSKTDNNLPPDHAMTSDLHGSLVAQILSLQRDRDLNLASVGRLEEAVALAHAENEELQAEFKRNDKQRHIHEREIQAAETTTLLALEELCRERDTARAAAEDLRLRRESLERRLKEQQDEAALAIKLLNDERAKWEAEKRELELKAQIAKAKLDTVLQQAAEEHELAQQHESEDRQHRHDSVVGQADEEFDVPTPRAEETNSRRSSIVTITGSSPSMAKHGSSLADELDRESANEATSEHHLRPVSSFDPSISPSLDVSTRTSFDFAEEEAPVRNARAVRLSQTSSSEVVSTVVNTTPPRHSMSSSDSWFTPRNGSPRKSREEHTSLREELEMTAPLPNVDEVPGEEQVDEAVDAEQTFDPSLLVDSYNAPTPQERQTVDYVTATSTPTPAQPQKSLNDIHDLFCVPISDNMANQRRKRTVQKDAGQVQSKEADKGLAPQAIANTAEPDMSSVSTQTDLDASEPRVQYVNLVSPVSESDFAGTSSTANAASQTIVSSLVDTTSPGTKTNEAGTKQHSLQSSARISSLFNSAAHRNLHHQSSRDSGLGAKSDKLSPPYAIPARRSSKLGSQLFSPDQDWDIATPTRRPNSSSKKRQHTRKSSTKPVVLRSRNGPVLSRQASQEFVNSRPASRAGSPPHTPRRRTLVNQDQRAKYSYEYSQDHSTDSQDVAVAPETPVQGQKETDVVDAIAATMIGEWMWKYVKGRSDDFLQNSAKAVRHKRWVWLAPQDRAILWSEKQPTSSAALMGRSGRKMIIQSVVDVVDNTALPKGASRGEVCNRSIIVLTPERAIKFTASTEERHYLWLSALTYLSKQNIPQGLPIKKRSVNEDKEQSYTNTSKASDAMRQTSLGSASARQTKFPFPFDQGSLSNATSTFASPARGSMFIPELADNNISSAPRFTSPNFINPLASNPVILTPADEADWVDCASPPAIPRLPSTTSSLHKKSSNMSLRPSATRTWSDQSRGATSMTDLSRPFIAPRANTGVSVSSSRSGYSHHKANNPNVSAPGLLAPTQSSWPVTPPRSSSFSYHYDSNDEEPEEDEQNSDEDPAQDSMTFSATTDFFDRVVMTSSFPPLSASSTIPHQSQKAATAPAPIPKPHRGLGHPLLDRVLSDDDKIFGSSPLRSHPVRQASFEESRRASVDSVAPPSIELTRPYAFGSANRNREGRVGRRLWR